jgi:hypothetical protein
MKKKNEKTPTNRQLAKYYYQTKIEEIMNMFLKADIDECLGDDHEDYDIDEVYFYVKKFLNRALLIGGEK